MPQSREVSAIASRLEAQMSMIQNRDGYCQCFRHPEVQLLRKQTQALIQTTQTFSGVQQRRQPAAHDRWNQHPLRGGAGRSRASFAQEAATGCN
jgi:hypothetical protein